MARIFFGVIQSAAIGLMVLLAGCRSASPVIPPIQIVTALSPTEAPSPSFTPSPTPTKTNLFSNQAILNACDLDLQAQAMLPTEIPSWSNLSLDACYDLSLDLTSGSTDYSGKVKITYTNNNPLPLPNLLLRTYPNADVIYGGTLDILSAKVDGVSLGVKDELPDGTAVRILLSEKLLPGKTITLEIDFRGQLPVDFGGDQTYGIFNFDSDGPLLMMANSYPILAEWHDGSWREDPVNAYGDAVLSRTALYLASITVRDTWKLAATGVKLTAKTSDGNTVYQYASGPVREFILAASPAFQSSEVISGDIVLRHWGFEKSRSGRDEALLAAKNSMALFNEKFGQYPFTELDIIAAPLRNAAGVEYPGVILIGDYLYPYSRTPRRLPNVVAHEVAHQWWYSLVGSDVFLHPWQDEALATFSAQLYEQVYNPGYYSGAKSFYQQAVTDIESELGTQRIDQSAASFSGKPTAYGVVEYHKGYLFFEEIRSEIGDTAFMEALQAYYRSYKYASVEPADLLVSFEVACKCILSDTFVEWGVQ